MVASLVQMGSRYFDYRYIGFRITQNHHEAFRNRTSSVVDTSPIGDSGLFGRRTGCIPHLGLVGVRCGKFALLGGVESSGERDIAEVLGSPRGVSAPRLVPTRLKVTTPLGGSIQRNIPSPNVRLLVW